MTLDPTIGSEIQKTRPCVVISPPELNRVLHTVIVAPMTTGSKPAPYRVPIGFGRKRGLIVLDQLRTVDKQRLVKRLGKTPARVISQTLRVLQEIFED